MAEYNRTQWVTGDPITQEKMNNIEQGIVDSIAGVNSNATTLSATNTNLSNLQTTVGNVSTVANNAKSTAETALQETQQGKDAWTQVAGAITIDQETNEITKNLATRFSEDESNIQSATQNVNLLNQEITTARGQLIHTGNSASASNLKAKLDDMDSQISLNKGAITSAQGDYANAKGYYNSLQARLNSIDGDGSNAGTYHEKSLASHVQDVENEITDAHISTVNNTTYDSLDARLEAEETAISNVNSNKVAYTDIVDNLDQSNTDKPLSANQGRVIKTMLGGNYSSSNTVATAISNAQSNAESYADTHKVDKTDIYNGVDHTDDDQKVLDARVGKTLKDAIDTIDSSLNTASTGLVARVSALETEVDMTSANSRIDEALSRIEAVDNSSTGTVHGLDTRLTNVENEITAAHRTGLVDGNNESITDSLDNRFDDAESRITATENAISHAANPSESDPGGLTQRITTVESDLNTASTGVKARISTLESDLNTSITGIKDRLTAVENTAGAAATATDLSTLAGRVTTLEGKDTIIVNVPASGSNYTEGAPNIASPSENADYLIADDEGKYFYWRYFGSTIGWQLVGGAGGSGNGSSSGVILASLPAVSEGDPNTDYFVGSNANGYIHYRFIEAGDNELEGHYIEILPKGLIDYLGLDTYGNPVAYTREDHNTNLLGQFYALKGVTYTPNYDPNDSSTLVSQTLQFTRTDGETLDPIVIVGGGGGSGSVYTVRIETTTDIARTFPANNTDPVTITAKVVMKQGNSLINGATANGYIQYRVAGASTWNTGDRIEVTADTEVLKYTIQNDTYFTVDVTKYLQTDRTIQIRLAIEAHPESEEETVMRYQTFSISKVNISIADEEFDYASVKNSNFQFNYRCFGSGITKTVHFLLDGTDIVTPVTTNTHNTVLQQVIPMTGKSNGMHTFQVYFVTSTGLESNRLNYYILYNTDNTRQAPLLGAAAENVSIVDGDELLVKYSVSTGSLETTDTVDIELYTMDNGNKTIIQTSELTDVPNNELQTWRTFNYPKVVQTTPNVTPDPITVYVKLTATHTVDVDGTPTDLTDSRTITVSISYLNTTYDLDPEGTNNLLYSYVSYGRSNNDANKETYTYNYTTVGGQNVQFTGTLSNFNWSTDGYADGKSLIIGGGATYSINVPIFNTSFNGTSIEENANVQDITQIGRTIEIDYEVQSATDLNDVIIDCMSQSNIGFQVTPQSCYLTNSSAAVEMDSSGFILNEDQVAAAYLSPGQRTHLVFVIEPWATTAQRDASFDGEFHQSTNIYVNGEFANACPYNRDKNTGNLAGNNFSTNATITIGSDTCLIKLYSIKLYNRGLTAEQVLQNYKVAPIATRDKLDRLEENDILNSAGEVDYEKAKTKYTCLLLTGPEPTNGNGDVVPTVSPFKGSPSPAGRRDKKTNEIVGKTESGLTLTKPSKTEASGYTVEFDLRDTVPTDQNIEIPAYIGARGAYCSSNNVQGTSSQKYPVHNLKVYLAKWANAKAAVYEEDPETHEQVLVSAAEPAQIKKVKYCLKGKDDNGDLLGTEESTLCWKADYMSTDHANTFNANVADGLFNNRAEDGWPITNWAAKHYQNTVYGIRCLLFQKQGDNAPVFIGDGCLNNDKGNSKTYGLEAEGDDGNDTRSQKWEFTNNSEDLGYFKTDDLTAPMNDSIRAKNGFECTYPDEGDLKDEGLEPNYNHLQILLTWLSKRANYWDETDPTAKAEKKAIFKNEFTKHFNLNHVLTYYIFSQYIALCDNRVKNMFLRSDNIREEVIRNTSGTVILNGNNDPDALWSNYVSPSTGATTPSYIDWATGEGHSNFAIWEPVLYDLDSCFGVENVGLIKIRYDADWDYEWKGTPQFNGYNSILWLQVEDSFQSEIAALAVSLYNANPGLNFRTFNQQQIIENQAQISPALTNQDMILKFDKPWSEGFINYAETPDGNGNYPKQTPLYKYLQRGSRAAQKSQFIQQRSMLLSSYYGADEFLNSSIKFRTGVPVGASGNVIGQDDQGNDIYGTGDLTETQITLKANQILYPGVAYGDNKPATRVLTNGGKVAAGTSCTIQATSAVQGNDGIFIYGASVLTDIGDISKFKPLQLDVSAGVNLKRLIIGSNASGYSNNTTNNITGLNKCLLLEEINVRNLKQMSTLTLTSNGFIKEIYAAGSNIGTISLPQGGVLETIEYGANTTDITIINQGRLTNFSYEDSENNNYGNVTRLWIENTPNVPIKEIITKRLQYLQAGGLRIAGLTLNLGNDASFLELITSELAKGTYLTASGGHTEGNNQYPFISGTITIYDIRQSLLTKLNSIYPNLTINVTHEVVREYEITYKNYDGTLLYTDYRIGTEHFIDPVADTNPITHAKYITMPQKPDDVQYEYKFGTYTGTAYNRYSGWVRENTTTNPTAGEYVAGTTTFIAYYPTTVTKQYTVTWYDEPNGQQLLSYTANYGSPIGTFNQPEDSNEFVRAAQTGTGYKVFKGWSRPVGKLTGDMNVYAQWETSALDSNITAQDLAMNNLNAADIYALSQLINGSGNASVLAALESKLGNDPIFVDMGRDFEYTEGVNTTNLLGSADRLSFDGTPEEAKVYNGQSGRAQIKPLALNSDWTLAIDYKFILNSAPTAQELVLASCYQNANSTIQGFKLSLVNNSDITTTGDYKNYAIKVSWGTESITVDYVAANFGSSSSKQYGRSYRNIVVLRHDASAPTKLYVYYAPPDISSQYSYTNHGYGIEYGLGVRNTTLTWANVDTLDVPLILGGNYNGATTNIENSEVGRKPANGIVYWAKYWDTDLGIKNCTALASWIHEKVPFYLSGYNNNNTPTRQILTGTNLTFVAAQGLGDRCTFNARVLYNDNDEEVTEGGWRYARARGLLNNRIYNGMSTAYQSVIKQTAIPAYSLLSDGNTFEYTSPSCMDYLFLPTEREVVSGSDPTTGNGGEVSRNWNSPWPWMKTENVTNVYRLNNLDQLVRQTATNIIPFLIRFSNNYITSTARIYNFDDNNDPDATVSGWSYNNTFVFVQSGDAWMRTDGIYIYYTNEDIAANGIYVDIITTKGGWKKAFGWNLRSYNTNARDYNDKNFKYINYAGEVVNQPNNTMRHEGRLLCPEFSV